MTAEMSSSIKNTDNINKILQLCHQPFAKS